MNPLNSILVATDTQLEDQSIVSAAAAVAKHHGASLMIVDVIQDLGWAARLSIQNLEHVRNSLHQVAGEKLNALAEIVREQGVKVETKLLEGKTSVSIVREVVSGQHDLLVAVGKGDKSRRHGVFGQTARQLLRYCPRALWLMPSGVPPTFKHVLACVDTSSEDPVDAELNDKIYTLAAAISEQQGSQLSVLHAWNMVDEAVLSARLNNETVDKHLADEADYRKRLFDKFLKQLRASVRPQDVHMIKESPPKAVSDFVAKENVDLVVMGSVGRSGLSGLLIGNTAEKILDGIECAVLAVKPYGFKCPIT